MSPVRDDELLGLRHRLLGLGASASLLDGLSPGRVAPAHPLTWAYAARRPDLGAYFQHPVTCRKVGAGSDETMFEPLDHRPAPGVRG